VSPDLCMNILLGNLSWDRAQRIARATQVEGAVPVYASGQPFLFLRPEVTLGSWAVHGLLAASAHWDAETWDMEAAELPRLVRTLEIVFEQIPEEFALEIMWSGDRASEERTLGRGAMLDVAREGKIGTRVRYRIQAASG